MARTIHNQPTEPTEAAKTPKRAQVPEFRALSRIDIILSDLSLPAAYRVLEQLMGRYGEMINAQDRANNVSAD